MNFKFTNIFTEYGPVAPRIKTPKKSSCMYICQHCLVHLGDIGKCRGVTTDYCKVMMASTCSIIDIVILQYFEPINFTARYRQQIEQAQTYYRHAAHLVPYNGKNISVSFLVFVRHRNACISTYFLLQQGNLTISKPS